MSVLVFGSVNIDRTFRLPHWIECGETILSSGLSTQAGGKGANQAVALSKAGTQTYLAGTIGEDGLWIRDLLSSFKVDTSLLNINEDIYTGTATILLDDKGRNSIVLYGGGNRANSEDYINEVLSHFKKGDWLILQNEINNLELIIRKAKEKEMKICLNPSPFEDYLLGLPLDEIDLFAVNEIEMSQLIGEKINDNIDSYRKALINASKKYPQTDILLTLGDKGSLFLTKDNPMNIIYSPIVKTDVVDTTAAGDTFLGYFLSSVINGKTFECALKTATKASSIAVSRLGAMDSIPFSTEVIK